MFECGEESGERWETEREARMGDGGNGDLCWGENDDLPDLSDDDGSFRDTPDWAISSQYIEISMEFIWK